MCQSYNIYTIDIQDIWNVYEYVSRVGSDAGDTRPTFGLDHGVTTMVLTLLVTSSSPRDTGNTGPVATFQSTYVGK